MNNDVRVAVCFSGFPCLSGYGSRLVRTLRNCLGDFDSFWFIPDDREKSLVQQLFDPTRLCIEPDKPISLREKPTKTRLKTGIQAYLQQIHGWQISNDLRERYEADSGITYDWVVRCRPDILFRSRLPPLHGFHPDRVTIPAFHSYGGYNDRFAIGNSENMGMLMNFFGFVCEYPSILSGVNAEKAFKRYLDSSQVPVEKNMKIRFDRIRCEAGRKIIKRDNRNNIVETLRYYRYLWRQKHPGNE